MRPCFVKMLQVHCSADLIEACSSYCDSLNLQAGVHPEQPCKTVDRASFEALWRHSVLLLQRGFKTGSILTVDEEEAKQLGKPWTRR